MKPFEKAGEMRPYVIRPGDYWSKLAHALGFEADAVWGDPANDAIRTLRPNRELLAPGDLVFLPAPTRNTQNSFPIEANTLNEYRLDESMCTFEIVFQGAREPIANEPFEVNGVDGGRYPKSTDGAGMAKFSVPVDTSEILVTFPRINRKVRVLVGHLDPIEELSGLWMRLEHLGLLRDPHDEGVPEEDRRTALRDAMVAFQVGAGLPPTGELDEKTRDALVSAHGS